MGQEKRDTVCVPWKVALLLNALHRVVELCDDGDADTMTREAARVAKEALAAVAK